MLNDKKIWILFQEIITKFRLIQISNFLLLKKKKKKIHRLKTHSSLQYDDENFISVEFYSVCVRIKHGNYIHSET